MFYLTNIDANVKLGVEFLNDLPSDFDIAKSNSEQWVPFAMIFSAPKTSVAITEGSCMTVYEAERIYNGIKNLLDHTGNNEDMLFTHYSYESIFEISIEYLHVDECFEVVLWFIIAENPEGRIEGYHSGFRFTADKPGMERFIAEFRDNFNRVCPQCPISDKGSQGVKV